MLLKELLELGKKIIKVNPEAAESAVRVRKGVVTVNYVNYDNTHKRKTTWLEE